MTNHFGVRSRWRRRRLWVIPAALTILTACSDSGGEAASTPTTATTATTVAEGPLVSFPVGTDGCLGDLSTLPLPQVSLVREGALYVADPDGGEAHCVTYPVTDLSAWSGDASALIANDDDVIVFGTGSFSFHDSSSGDGKMVFLGPTGDRLLLDHAFDPPQFVDLTGEFVSRSDAAPGMRSEGHIAASPSGESFAFSGKTEGSNQELGLGVWVVERGAPARLVDEAPAANDGRHPFITMTFLDEDQFLYAIMPPHTPLVETSLVSLATGDKVTVASQDAPSEITILKLVASGYATDRVAIATGACFEQASVNTSVLEGGTWRTESVDLEGYGFVSPAGWLDDGRLVVLGRPTACDGPGDVFLWSPSGGEVTLLAEGVTDALVRGRAQ